MGRPGPEKHDRWNFARCSMDWVDSFAGSSGSREECRLVSRAAEEEDRRPHPNI